MQISPEQYEKLGAFYLGRGYDLESGQPGDDIILYDSRDLVTHGVVLGMTGSGKTGLCLAMLEEAAIDGIPVIAIDPKGDIGNFLLTFPELNAGDFAPWVNPDDARRRNVSVADHAAAQAALWKKGLGEWGQDGERIRRLRESVDAAIYTPGSSAGLPVSILSSLAVPGAPVLEDAELLADRIEGTASSLLGLTGIEAEPVQSAEHVLVANILSHCWRQGQSLTLENLIRYVQQPPFRRVGVVDVDTFCPEAARTALALRLNNIIASPGFASWLEGEPLDVHRMMYTAEGKPRVAIFNVSHLNDVDRMFFVSLLLNEVVGWMRSQQGTTSLRAILYMDEIFGYLPPTAMPPSKKPLLILLKQARAFGLGVLLATQNPVDLDYKALSNIGTWWIGRLQTERDKARLLDGLEGASGAGGFDRSEMDRVLSRLGTRVFLMRNVHEDGSTVFNVRWVMCYMCGPLAREQVRRLMAGARSPGGKPAPAEDAGFLPPSAAAAAVVGDRVKPSLPEGASEFFLPAADGDRVAYRPAMLRCARVTFEDARRGVSGSDDVLIVNPIDGVNERVIWDSQVDMAPHRNVSTLATQPAPGATFAALPSAALKSSTYTNIAREFADWVFANHRLKVFRSPLLNISSSPGESVDQFRARVSQIARERRDQAVDELREKTARRLRTLEDRAARSAVKAETQKSQVQTATLTSAINIGGSILGAVLGRKRGFGSILKTTNVNSAGRVHREQREAAAAAEELKRVQADIAGLEAELAAESAALSAQYDPRNLEMETISVAPLKKNIHVTATGIVWLPA